MRENALGVRIRTGRLGGAEIARDEDVREGSVPLHFGCEDRLRLRVAHTTYGVIGIKLGSIMVVTKIRRRNRSYPVPNR